MPKPIAVDGDTKVETSTANVAEDSNKTGRWQLSNSNVVKGRMLSVDGKRVELSATADWIYEGGSKTDPVSGATVTIPPISDNAVLMAGPTSLTDRGEGVLVDGDEATGSMDRGNKITVSASQQILSTSPRR